MFAGDENVASVPDQQDLEALRREITRLEGPGAEAKYLPFKPIWQRAAIIAAAGPAANFLLAIFIFSLLFMTVGESVLKPRIGAVGANTPAAAAGFQVGDLVLSADGQAIDDFGQLHRLVALRAGAPMHFTVQRGAQGSGVERGRRRASSTDDPKNDFEGQLGVARSRNPADFVERRYAPVQAVQAGVARTWDVLSTTVYYLARLIEGKQTGHELRSFIGIAPGVASRWWGRRGERRARAVGADPGRFRQPDRHGGRLLCIDRLRQSAADPGARWRAPCLLRL